MYGGASRPVTTYRGGANMAAFSPLNNFFEAEEGAQIQPSYSRARMFLNYRHHSPSKNPEQSPAPPSSLSLSSSSSAAEGETKGEEMLVKTYQGQALANSAHKMKEAKYDHRVPVSSSSLSSSRAFSDGLTFADSQTLDNLTRRLYDLDKDRLEDTQYRLDNKGSLLMSRFKEHTATQSQSLSQSHRHVAHIPNAHHEEDGTYRRVSSLSSEDLDKGVSLAMALNTGGVPAALRVRHAEAMERFRGSTIAKQQPRHDDHDDDDTSAADTSLHITDLTASETPVQQQQQEKEEEVSHQLQFLERYDYEPGMVGNTNNSRGGSVKASLFQSPSLATRRAEHEKYGDDPHRVMYRAERTVREGAAPDSVRFADGGYTFTHSAAKPTTSSSSSSSFFRGGVGASEHTKAQLAVLASASEVAARAELAFGKKSQWVDPLTGNVKAKHSAFMAGASPATGGESGGGAELAGVQLHVPPLDRSGLVHDTHTTVPVYPSSVSSSTVVAAAASAAVSESKSNTSDNGASAEAADVNSCSFLGSHAAAPVTSNDEEEGVLSRVVSSKPGSVPYPAVSSSSSSSAMQRIHNVMVMSTASRVGERLALGLDVSSTGVSTAGTTGSGGSGTSEHLGDSTRGATSTGSNLASTTATGALRTGTTAGGRGNDEGRFHQRIMTYSALDADRLVHLLESVSPTNVNNIKGYGLDDYGASVVAAKERASFSVLSSSRGPVDSGCVSEQQTKQHQEAASASAAAAAAGVAPELYSQMMAGPGRAYGSSAGAVIVGSSRESVSSTGSSEDDESVIESESDIEEAHAESETVVREEEESIQKHSETTAAAAATVVVSSSPVLSRAQPRPEPEHVSERMDDVGTSTQAYPEPVCVDEEVPVAPAFAPAVPAPVFVEASAAPKKSETKIAAEPFKAEKSPTSPPKKAEAPPSDADAAAGGYNSPRPGAITADADADALEKEVIKTEAPGKNAEMVLVSAPAPAVTLHGILEQEHIIEAPAPTTLHDILEKEHGIESAAPAPAPAPISDADGGTGTAAVDSVSTDAGTQPGILSPSAKEGVDDLDGLIDLEDDGVYRNRTLATDPVFAAAQPVDRKDEYCSEGWMSLVDNTVAGDGYAYEVEKEEEVRNALDMQEPEGITLHQVLTQEHVVEASLAAPRAPVSAATLHDILEDAHAVETMVAAPVPSASVVVAPASVATLHDILEKDHVGESDASGEEEKEDDEGTIVSLLSEACPVEEESSIGSAAGSEKGSSNLVTTAALSVSAVSVADTSSAVTGCDGTAGIHIDGGGSYTMSFGSLTIDDEEYGDDFCDDEEVEDDVEITRSSVSDVAEDRSTSPLPVLSHEEEKEEKGEDEDGSADGENDNGGVRDETTGAVVVEEVEVARSSGTPARPGASGTGAGAGESSTSSLPVLSPTLPVLSYEDEVGGEGGSHASVGSSDEDYADDWDALALPVLAPAAVAMPSELQQQQNSAIAVSTAASAIDDSDAAVSAPQQQQSGGNYNPQYPHLGGSNNPQQQSGDTPVRRHHQSLSPLSHTSTATSVTAIAANSTASAVTAGAGANTSARLIPLPHTPPVPTSDSGRDASAEASALLEQLARMGSDVDSPGNDDADLHAASSSEDEREGSGSGIGLMEARLLAKQQRKPPAPVPVIAATDGSRVPFAGKPATEPVSKSTVNSSVVDRVVDVVEATAPVAITTTNNVSFVAPPPPPSPPAAAIGSPRLSVLFGRIEPEVEQADGALLSPAAPVESANGNGNGNNNAEASPDWRQAGAKRASAGHSSPLGNVQFVTDNHGNTRLGLVGAVDTPVSPAFSATDSVMISTYDEHEEHDDDAPMESDAFFDRLSGGSDHSGSVKTAVASSASFSARSGRSASAVTPKRRDSKLASELDSARSFLGRSSSKGGLGRVSFSGGGDSSPSSLFVASNKPKRRLTLQQIQRRKGAFMGYGGEDDDGGDAEHLHAFGDDDDDHYHQHHLHWVPVADTLNTTLMSDAASVTPSVRMSCRISHARSLCIFARWLSHRQDIVAAHFEVRNHTAGLFNDNALSLPSVISEPGSTKKKSSPNRYDWQLEEDEFGLFGMSTRDTAGHIEYEGRAPNASVALGYYHRLTGGDVRFTEDNDGNGVLAVDELEHVMVSEWDLTEEERYLRVRMIEHCRFRTMQDIFHAMCVYTGIKHNTKSMTYHLRHLTNVGWATFSASMMKGKMRTRRANLGKILTHPYFHGAAVTDAKGDIQFELYPSRLNVKSSPVSLAKRRKSTFTGGSGGGGAGRRTSILDRIFTTSTSNTHAYDGNTGQISAVVMKNILLKENKTKQHRWLGPTGNPLLHHPHVALPSATLPAALQREEWRSILSVSLSHRRLSSAPFYLIEMSGEEPIHMENQSMLFKLFMLRRLYKRTVGEKQQRVATAKIRTNVISRTFAFLHKGAVQGSVKESAMMDAATAQQTSYMRVRRDNAYGKLRRYRAVVRDERAFYAALRNNICSRPAALRAVMLARNRFLVWFFDSIKDNYERSEITEAEIVKTESHYLKIKKRLSLSRWLMWKREMSRQRVNEKTYAFHKHVLVRNRRMALHATSSRRESGDRMVDWFGDGYFTKIGHSSGWHVDGTDDVEVPISDMERDLKDRVTPRDCIDTVHRMHMYRAFTRMFRFASVRRYFYSESDAYYSSYAVTPPALHGPVSLTHPARNRAIANDRLASIKTRPHLFSGYQEFSVGMANPVPQELKSGEMRARCTNIAIPLSSYHPNPLLFANGNTFAHTKQTNEGLAMMLVSTRKRRTKVIVGCEHKSNSHRFRIRAYHDHYTSSSSSSNTQDTGRAKTETETPHNNDEEDDDASPCGTTVDGITTVRRGLIRALNRQNQDGESPSNMAALSKWLQPPCILDGATLPVKNVEKSAGNIASDSAYAPRSRLASAPMLLAYTKHWLFHTRVYRRLRSLSTALRLRVKAKTERWAWGVLRRAQQAQTQERSWSMTYGYGHIADRVGIIVDMKEAMKKARRHWKLVHIRRLFNHTTNLSYGTLSAARGFIRRIHRAVEQNVVIKNELGTTVELSKEQVIRRSGGRAITTLSSNPYMRARIRQTFYRACGNRTGSEFSFLESTFTATDDTSTDNAGSVIYGTGIESRRHAIYTASLVTAGLARHIACRTLLKRVIVRARRRLQNRDTLKSTIASEMREALRYLRYYKDLQNRRRRCEVMGLWRKLRDWRTAVVCNKTRKFLMRSSLLHIADANKQLKADRAFLRPFVLHTVQRKVQSAMDLWKSKVTFLETIRDKLNVDTVLKRKRDTLQRMCHLFLARKHHRKYVRGQIFRRMQRWVFLSLRSDTLGSAVRKWQWRINRTVTQRERNDSLLRVALMRRGLARLRDLVAPPSKRFKRVFLVTAMKLKNTPVYPAFFRRTVIEKQFAELNRLRFMEVNKGSILKCLSEDLLLNRPTIFTKPPKTRQNRAVDAWQRSNFSASRAKSISLAASVFKSGDYSGHRSQSTLFPGLHASSKDDDESIGREDHKVMDSFELEEEGAPSGAQTEDEREKGTDDEDDVLLELTGDEEGEGQYLNRLYQTLGVHGQQARHQGPSHGIRTEKVMVTQRIGAIGRGYLNATKIAAALHYINNRTWLNQRHIPACLSHHKHNTVRLVALKELHQHAAIKAIVRSNFHKVLFLRSMHKFVVRKEVHSRELELLRVAAGYHVEKSKRLALRHLLLLTQKKRWMRHNHTTAIGYCDNKQMALGLLLWKVSAGNKVENEEEEDFTTSGSGYRYGRRSYNDFNKEERHPNVNIDNVFGLTLSRSEMRRRKAGYSNW
jgi:hypothetical protein